MKTSLTKREKEIANVASDLLCKGSPATRIALYCIKKGLTEIQISRFLDKLLDLGIDLKTDVHFAYWKLTTSNFQDENIKLGNKLKEKLNIYE